MRTHEVPGIGFSLSVKYPEAGWYAASSIVPNLYSPRELGAISNRPLRKLPVTSDQNTPDVSALGATGILIWIYYEVLGEVLGNPVIRDPERPPIPDYSRFSYPLVYGESQLFPPQLAYDWSSSILCWAARRIQAVRLM